MHRYGDDSATAIGQHIAGSPEASRAQSGSPVPLCVDLDGTLLRTDTVVEGCLKLLRKSPLTLLRLLLTERGIAAFKAEVARRVDLAWESLPVNRPLLDWLARCRNEGRPLILITGAPQRYAQAAAARFSMFDRVLHSDATVNLTGSRKAQRLAAEFGAAGYDYAGNAVRDLPVWRGARNAIVVTPTLWLLCLKSRIPRIAQTFVPPARPARWLRCLRAHHWVKNVLVFVPAAAAHRLADPATFGSAALAFVSFCLIASGTYVINDLLDLDADRAHPTKRHRPVPAGEISIVAAGAAALIGVVLGLACGALYLGRIFAAVVAAYLALTLWYSASLKQRAITDILCLAALYTLRIIGGSAATAIEPSFWLLAFSMFLFLSLGAAKRAAELGDLDTRKESQAAGRGYTVQDLPLLLTFGIAAAYSSVLVLALYIFQKADQLYSRPELLWLVCPGLLYWVSRIWLKTYRRQVPDDPVVFAFSDIPSVIVVLGCLALAWLAI